MDEIKDEKTGKEKSIIGFTWWALFFLLYFIWGGLEFFYGGWRYSHSEEFFMTTVLVAVAFPFYWLANKKRLMESKVRKLLGWPEPTQKWLEKVGGYKAGFVAVMAIVLCITLLIYFAVRSTGEQPQMAKFLLDAVGVFLLMLIMAM